MGSTPIQGTLRYAHVAQWQTRCFQVADVGGSSPLMGTISGCGAIW